MTRDTSGEGRRTRRRRRHPAESPGELTKVSWRQALRRTPKEFKADNLSDWAAALTLLRGAVALTQLRNNQGGAGAALVVGKFDAELERARAVETGHPGEKEPYVEPRDTRRL